MSVHGIYVLIVFNGRRTHAWFKQILKLERMFFPVVDKNAERVLRESGGPVGRVSDWHTTRPTGTDLLLCCCTALAPPALPYADIPSRAFTSWLIIPVPYCVCT